MPHSRRSAQPVALSPCLAALVAMGLSGCGALRPVAGYPVIESPDVAAAPWPRLADGPTHVAPPSPGPDPALGATVVETLTDAARAASTRAAALAGPVVPVDDLRGAAAAARAGRPIPP